MIKPLLAISVVFLTHPALGDTVVAAGTIRSQAIIGYNDVTLTDDITPGALTDLLDAVGQEARVNLYPGRPIRAGDLTAPAVVDRNQIIVLLYNNAGLRITADGRSMDRGGIGDRLRILNLSSRTTVFGTVTSPGVVSVGPLN
jgi:flagella basal body P-ring formation protein FlgA